MTRRRVGGSNGRDRLLPPTERRFPARVAVPSRLAPAAFARRAAVAALTGSRRRCKRPAGGATRLAATYAGAALDPTSLIHYLSRPCTCKRPVTVIVER